MRNGFTMKQAPRLDGHEVDVKLWCVHNGREYSRMFSFNPIFSDPIAQVRYLRDQIETEIRREEEEQELNLTP